MGSKPLKLDIEFFANTIRRTNDVLSTLVNSVNAFNTQQWDAYANCLDQNVVAYNITALGYLVGRDAVVTFFRNNAPQTFELTNRISLFPNIYPLSISGVALWTHAVAGHTRAPIHYQFQFAPGDFLLTSLWAEHADASTGR